MVACLEGKMLYVQQKRLELSIGVWSLRAVGREMKNRMQTRRDESQIASLPFATWNALHVNSLYFISLSDIENLNRIRVCIVDGLQIVFDVIQGLRYFILSRFLFSIQNIIFWADFPPLLKIPKLLRKLVRLESIFCKSQGNERKIPDTYQWNDIIPPLFESLNCESLSANKVDCRVSSKKRKGRKVETRKFRRKPFGLVFLELCIKFWRLSQSSELSSILSATRTRH